MLGKINNKLIQKYMKATLIAIIVVIVMVAALVFKDSETISYVREQVEVEKIVETTPDWASDPQAVEAAKAVIRKKELEAELKALDTEIKELTDKRKTVAQELDGY